MTFRVEIENSNDATSSGDVVEPPAVVTELKSLPQVTRDQLTNRKRRSKYIFPEKHTTISTTSKGGAPSRQVSVSYVHIPENRNQSVTTDDPEIEAERESMSNHLTGDDLMREGETRIKKNVSEQKLRKALGVASRNSRAPQMYRVALCAIGSEPKSPLSDTEKTYVPYVRALISIGTFEHLSPNTITFSINRGQLKRLSLFTKYVDLAEHCQMEEVGNWEVDMKKKILPSLWKNELLSGTELSSWHCLDKVSRPKREYIRVPFPSNVHNLSKSSLRQLVAQRGVKDAEDRIRKEMSQASPSVMSAVRSAVPDKNMRSLIPKKRSYMFYKLLKCFDIKAIMKDSPANVSSFMDWLHNVCIKRRQELLLFVRRSGLNHSEIQKMMKKQYKSHKGSDKVSSADSRDSEIGDILYRKTMSTFDKRANSSRTAMSQRQIAKARRNKALFHMTETAHSDLFEDQRPSEPIKSKVPRKVPVRRHSITTMDRSVAQMRKFDWTTGMYERDEDVADDSTAQGPIIDWMSKTWETLKVAKQLSDIKSAMAQLVDGTNKEMLKYSASMVVVHALRNDATGCLQALGAISVECGLPWKEATFFTTLLTLGHDAARGIAIANEAVARYKADPRRSVEDYYREHSVPQSQTVDAIISMIPSVDGQSNVGKMVKMMVKESLKLARLAFKTTSLSAIIAIVMSCLTWVVARVDPFNPRKTVGWKALLTVVTTVETYLPSWRNGMDDEAAQFAFNCLEVLKTGCMASVADTKSMYFTPHQIKRINDLTKDVDYIVSAHMGVKAGVRRVEPVTVMFNGETGLGKSLGTDMLCNQLAKLNGYMNPNHTFCYNEASEFWEGYEMTYLKADRQIVDTPDKSRVYARTGTCTMTCDDLFQIHDKTKRGESAQRLFSVLSGQTKMLNMAEIGKKGNTYVNFPFCIMSSNLTKFETNTIGVTDPMAFKRRLTFIVEPIRPIDTDNAWEDKFLKVTQSNGIFQVGTLTNLMGLMSAMQFERERLLSREDLSKKSPDDWTEFNVMNENRSSADLVGPYTSKDPSKFAASLQKSQAQMSFSDITDWAKNNKVTETVTMHLERIADMVAKFAGSSYEDEPDEVEMEDMSSLPGFPGVPSRRSTQGETLYTPFWRKQHSRMRNYHSWMKDVFAEKITSKFGDLGSPKMLACYAGGVMMLCAGLWVAHGDRNVTDEISDAMDNSKQQYGKIQVNRVSRKGAKANYVGSVDKVVRSTAQGGNDYQQRFSKQGGMACTIFFTRDHSIDPSKVIRSSVKGIVLFGGVVLTVSHAWPSKGTSNVVIVAKQLENCCTTFILDHRNVRRYGVDFASFKVPGLQSPASILPYIVKRNDMARLPVNIPTGFMIDCSLEDESRVVRYHLMSLTFKSGTQYEVGHPDEDVSVFEHRETIRYDMDTYGGDCGSMIGYTDDSGAARIIGMHVSALELDRNGNPQAHRGISAPLTRELIEEVYASHKVLVPSLERLNVKPDDSVAQTTEVRVDVDDFKTVLENDCVYGMGRSFDNSHISLKNNIHKSPLHEYFGESKMRPCVPNGNFGGEKPVVKAFKPYRSINKIVDGPTQHIVEAMQVLRDKIPVNSVTTPLTLEESINGTDHLPSIELSTSAGHMPHGLIKKNDWIDVEYDTTTGRLNCGPKNGLRLLYDSRLSRAREGLRTFAPAAVKCKIEKLPREKVGLQDKEIRRLARNHDYDEEQFLQQWIDRSVATIDGATSYENESLRNGPKGKVRLINAFPLDYTLANRSYFLKTATYIESLHNDGPIVVGINAHNYEWALLYKRMSRSGGTLLAGDFSRYDQSIPECVARASAMFMVETGNLRGEDHEIAKVLAEEFINPIGLAGDQVFQLLGANPTGSPLTSIHNSVVNFIVLYCCIKHVANEHDIDFDMGDIEWALYGDDNLIWIPHENFPVNDLGPAAMSLFGMILTNASKELEMKGITIDDAVFLGRSFNVNDGVVHAPLAKWRIEEMLYWYKGPDSTRDDILAQQINAFMLEMSHHGRRQFNLSVDHLRSREYVTRLSLVKWCTYDDIMKKRFGNSSFTKSVPEMAVSHTYILPGENRTEDVGNDIDRAVRRAEVTDGQEQVNFEDTEGIDEVDNDRENPMIGVFPADSHVNYDLERLYLVGQWTWTETGLTPEIGLTPHLSLPRELFQQRFLVDRLRGFSRGRWAYEIEVRVNSQPMNSGALIMNYSPNPYTTETAPLDHPFNMSKWPHSVIMAETNETQTVKLPQLWYSPLYDVDQLVRLVDTNPTAALLTDHWRIDLTVLAPLMSSSDNLPQPVTVNMFAKMVDVELFMPSTLDESVAQASYLAKGAKMATQVQEAVDVAKTGADLLTGGRKGAISGFLSKIPIVGSFAGGLASMIGLEKPTDVSAITVSKWDYSGSMANSVGVDSVTRLMPHREGYVDCDDKFTGDFGYDDFSEMLGTPSLVALFETSDVDPSSEVHINPARVVNIQSSADPVQIQTLLGETMLPFNLWRGSIKICVMFICPKLVSARIKITFNAPGSEILNTVNDYDMYSKIVDVAGNTVTTFTLPYISPKIMERTTIATDETTGSVGGILHFDLVGRVNAQATSFPIRTIVYWSGGEDFDLRWPGHDLVKDFSIAQWCPREVFKERFEPFHDGMTFSQTSNVTAPDTFTCVKDVLAYYCWQAQCQLVRSTPAPGDRLVEGHGVTLMFNGDSVNTVNQLIEVSTGTKRVVQNQSMMTWYKELFHYHRGSSRYKIQVTPPNGQIMCCKIEPFDLTATGDNFHSKNGISMTASPMELGDTSYRSMMDVEVPWMYQQLMIPNNISVDKWEDTGYTTITPHVSLSVTVPGVETPEAAMFVNIYSSVGDDFRMGFFHGSRRVYTPVFGRNMGVVGAGSTLKTTYRRG